MKRRAALIAVVALASLVSTSYLFWFFEHGQNPNLNSILDLVYWWTVTSGTVGYGDIVPVTPQGKVVVIIAIFTGFFIFANLVAVLAQYAHNYLERRILGKAKVQERHHIVICEYTAVADEMIQSLPLSSEFAGKRLVIVSDLVQKNPYPQHHFVSGVPISPAALHQANVEYADYVFVFANLRFADPDVKTIHIASRVRKLNATARIFVEMTDPNHRLFEYAGPNVIPMDSRELMETVLKDKRIDPAIFVERFQRLRKS